MRIAYGVIIVVCFCLLMLGTRACETPVETRKNIDTIQDKVDKYKAEIDSLKTEYLTLLNNRAVKIKTLREYRTKYVHDTINLQSYFEDTAKLRSLIDENRLLIEIVYEDSLIIANQGQMVIYQDSVISNLEAIRDTQKDLLSNCANEVKKQRKKANFWRSLAVIFGLVAIAK